MEGTGTVTTSYSYDAGFFLATYGRVYSGHAVLDAAACAQAGGVCRRVLILPN